MSDKHLHIVSFDIPFPPNYGGVIDVYYKLVALKKQGVKVHLHCFEYPGRDRANELNELCESVDYYRRKTGLISALSRKPYILKSRRSKRLLQNLQKDDHPVLFEGLHSCYYLTHKSLKNKFKIYRESNIEHRYYYNLYKVERKLFDKLYYFVESVKLRFIQKMLSSADLMLAVSKNDTDYLKGKFPEHEVQYLPSFHSNEDLKIIEGKGEYVLYHGNIEVPENAFAAEYLINEVFNDGEIPLIVAGMNPPAKIKNLVATKQNITLIANPDDAEMFRLIREAHVNVLVTFQATGLKLKLLNTLYMGRFCVVNDKMLNGTSLDDLCIIANNPASIKNEIKRVFSENFDRSEFKKREEKLDKLYSNVENAKKLIGFIS